METRASYAVVGSFVLIMVAALFAFLVFVTKAQFDNVTQPYHVYFSGSVTGLQEGSAVRYHGVGVGAVRDIRIAPDDPSRIRVTIELDGANRLPSDSNATIEPQGITGLAYIQIIGGEKGSALMDVRSGDIPVIPSRPSQIAEVVDAAPELLNRMIILADRTSAFLTPEKSGGRLRLRPAGWRRCRPDGSLDPQSRCQEGLVRDRGDGQRRGPDQRRQSRSLGRVARHRAQILGV